MSTENTEHDLDEDTEAEALAYRGGHYEVVARRWSGGWELHIDGVGVTQCRTLASADRTAREYLALEYDLTEHDFDVTITPELDEATAAEIAAARESTRQATERQKEAAARWRTAARRLRASGFSGADTAVVLGVSEQRVSQLRLG